MCLHKISFRLELIFFSWVSGQSLVTVYIECNEMKFIARGILLRSPAGIYLLKVNSRNTRAKVRNMFRVNNKATKTTPMGSSHLCSGVSIVNFEHVIA